LSLNNQIIINSNIYRLVDTHIHLSAPEFISIQSELINYLKMTQTLVFSVSETLKTSIETLKISSLMPKFIIPFVGIHPKFTVNCNLDQFDTFFNKNLNLINGIGEIGLDKTYIQRGINFTSQIKVFEHMLKLAEKSNKPISIHSRNATQDTIQILSSYNIKKIIFHWFSGTASELLQVQNYGYLTSFGPALVYSKSIQKLALSSNPEFTVVETDGPVRFSACFEGKMAEPSFIPSIIQTLSNIWNISPNNIISQMFNNLKNYINV